MAKLTTKEVILKDIESKLPPYFTRTQAAEALRGIVGYHTLRKSDSEGKGPLAVRNGRDVMYERDAFILWLTPRIKDTNNPTSC